MGLHKLTAGDGYTYLIRQVAVHHSTEKGQASLGDYYAQKGEAPGRWMGSGLTGLDLLAGSGVTAEQMKALFGEGRHPNATAIGAAVIAAGGTVAQARKASALGKAFAIYPGQSGFQIAVARAFTAHNIDQGLKWNTPIPAPQRARIRTDIATALFSDAFGRAPVDARELSGFIAKASRQVTTAVAGYDLTFSPVKSVSALWAIAPRDIAAQVEAAHDAAVAETISWLERTAAYTRTGRGGVRQVEVRGLLAAAFTHRDARSGDPDLHTHVAVSNKVQTLDGRWFALDGRVLYKANVSASERYNTRLEAELVDRLGVRFAERPGDDPRRRPVREIVGVPADLTALWSSRRAAVEARRSELAVAFQGDHGRPPTVVEAIALAQQATLETRAGKHAPRSAAEQRATWRAQAIEVLRSAGGLEQILSGVLDARQSAPLVDDKLVDATAAAVLAVVSSSRATWQSWHVHAEAQRQARAAGVALADLDRLVDLVARRALSAGYSIPLDPGDRVAEPSMLRRRDGTSVYLVAGAKLYTSRSVIDAERSLIAAARRTDGRALTAQRIEMAIGQSAAQQRELNPAQAQMVRELATSGARLQVVIAPAGSGKTTAMRVLARAWTDSGGNVLGLAPSARAAAELRDSIGATCDTLAKLITSLDHQPHPPWVQAIGPGTLVIIDEAGMAGTADLARAVGHVVRRGGSVRLIGDDQQLAAIAAGGVLRDIAEQIGAVTLSELRRFADPAEGAATLALRLGDPAGLGFYLDHQRVHVGDDATVADLAYNAWAHDRRSGLDAVMLAPTRELVSALNARARTDRLLAAPASTAPQTALADGNHASTGDTIITRHNCRQLAISPTDWVKNGDRWQVRTVHPDGSLDAQHLDLRRTITLPADYVRAHTELGYATTVHGAQGITADTCHLVASGTESRQVFYVAMTRGRAANHVYLTTAPGGDEHSIIKPEAVLPPTATDILTAIVRRDQAQRSAHTLARELRDPNLLLHQAAVLYQDALGFAAEHHIGDDTLRRLDEIADLLRPGLTDAPAYPTLRAHLALHAADGADPVALLASVAGPGARELDSAADPAAVIDWRLESGVNRDGPLPWLPAIPAALDQHRQWGHYLRARAEQITELAGHVRHRSATWTPTTAPRWAGGLLDPSHHPLRGELAVWRAAHDIPADDLRPTGRPQLAAAATRAQAALDGRATEVLGDPTYPVGAWKRAADRISPRIAADPFWPELAARLAAIDRTGINIAGMLHAVAAERDLPDEQPAAALWWRLSRHLTPAASTATTRSGAATLRPDWSAHLITALGDQRAGRVLADPGWPALVAAVNAAPRDEWHPVQLLDTAASLVLADRTHHDAPLADNELTSALVWRIVMLTDPTPLDIRLTPADPYEQQFAAPTDLHLLDLPIDPHSPAGISPNEHIPPVDEYPASASTYPASSAVPQLPFLPPTWADPVPPAAAANRRLAQLNEWAADFFAGQYQASWAPTYLHDRLGTDLRGDQRFRPGYAPASWTALTRHLHQRGASDDEILAAGLGQLSRDGTVIDQFRDRLMFPIHHGEQIHGFIGRRNPAADLPDAPAAGPKYLNTAQTVLFDKGAQLFGAHEARRALAAGATPVIVEGPLDAIAITIASGGSHVGLAPLGTAFTGRHADQLQRYLDADQLGVTVATDADLAGWKAAQRTYWLLTARGANPRHLLMPQGSDPATILEHGGSQTLRDLLEAPQPLARSLIDARINTFTGQLDTPEGRLNAARATAEVIGALPPTQWLEHIGYVADRLGTAPGTVPTAVIEAGHAFTEDPHGTATRQIGTIPESPIPAAPIKPDPASPRGALGGQPAPIPTESSASPVRTLPEDRWRELADSISPRLARDPGWIALAELLDQAQAHGINVEHELPLIAADGGPLSPQRGAYELRYRLLAATDLEPAPIQTPPPVTPPVPSQHRRSRPTISPDPRIDQTPSR